MPKRNSNKPVPPIRVRPDKDRIVEIRKYKVITPLYGGGVEPEQADPITVVRASEIRGHLRFWWRATRGGAFGGSLEKMRRREEEIWGSAGGKGKAGPSQVSIRVMAAQRGTELREVKTSRGTLEYGDPMSPYGYVAFPLRKTDDKPAGAVREKVTFSIEIRYPKEIAPDVQAALWAWETFGGIGARTRRGFGALQRQEGDEILKAHELREYIARKLNSEEYLSTGPWPAGVPHLTKNAYVLTAVKTSPDEAWRTLFEALKSFRQDRKTKLIKGKEKPFGRSKWPEPDEIRRLTNTHAKGHEPSHPVRKFPRGQFGLPIIFKFKDDTKGDPPKTTLEGAASDRLSSPLILRPIACADGAVGLALLLEWEPLNPDDEPYTPPGGLRLKDTWLDEPVQSTLEPDEAKHIPVLNGQTDVLQAFLDYVKGE